ncbi:transcription factor HES-7.1-B-like [Alosa sapidissima]|uniref:transcription factor HES-7.1-B-like n=1 Tax=Alosa sapidissima TaxID=34773 RepID=UPI001C07F45B|nr:transcription factor HES-7.1-B-like [Alosa sapidissima]XP_041947470.1 transcription factor HES-7.1-B-like [Alosa sapidissima]XP_041947471.1 transcription factor HES-7.1-B-like [Alosa sapidissima]XP_041947472.1 transcription factor HES-7.1-B-like [Alosa sapidissima]
MKLQLAVHHVKIDRKLLKPQVERRRRERINRCLETLSKMLMEDRENQKRTEKAEILEHTVAFLRSNSHHDSNNFHNGFSACLQKASEFLQTTDMASNQKLALSSRLDMVAVPQHHHPHLKLDVQTPLSSATVSKPLSPKRSASKAALWNPRSPGGHLTCQILCQKVDIYANIKAEVKAGISKSSPQPPPSSMSTVSPSHRRHLTQNSQSSTQASSPITSGYTGKELLPQTQLMWRPWS